MCPLNAGFTVNLSIENSVKQLLTEVDVMALSPYPFIFLVSKMNTLMKNGTPLFDLLPCVY